MTRFSSESLRSPGALACLLLPMILGVAVDLWAKAWTFDALLLGSPRWEDGQIKVDSRDVPVIRGLVHLHATGNQGAVFGSLQGFRWLFICISVLALGFLLLLFSRSKQQRFYQMILGMLMAGVLGNLYDRVAYGYVRDMIFVFPHQGWFPWIFNVADSLLCVGVGIMILYSFLSEQSDEDWQPGVVQKGESVSQGPVRKRQ